MTTCFKKGFLLLLILFSLSLSAQVNLTSGLVANYSFSGNANDVSGNGHHGTVVNGAALTADRFGNSNSAYFFDGLDDYIRIPDNGDFSTSQISISLWFKTNSDGIQNLVGKRKFNDDGTQAGGAQYQFFINYPPYPGIGSNLVLNNNSCSFVTSSSYINTGDIICKNKWYHAVITFDGAMHNIYIDGVLKLSSPTGASSMLNCLSELRFGVWWSGGTIPFSGIMDDIRWYNRPLNQAEITALYNNFPTSSSVDFSFTQNTCDPKTVQFSNLTSGATSLSWNFGNGMVSTSSNPSITYASYGNYPVKLIVQTSSGCRDSVSKITPVQLLQDSLITNGDTSICSAAAFQLNTLPGLDICWNTTTGLSDATIPNPMVAPVNSTTYYFTSKTAGHNIVLNGDFSSGNTAFQSDYIYSSSGSSGAQYGIGANPNTWNASYSSCGDHTTSTGNMMMINGSGTIGTAVWKQTINITPHTNYAFSTWIKSLNGTNPATLRFSINSSVLGTVISANGATCMWDRFFATWNSGNNTSVTIAVLNYNTIANGNDFALDDISFSEIILKYDSLKVTVLPSPVIAKSNDTVICNQGQASLFASGGNSYLWSPAAGLNNPGIANPVASPTAPTVYKVVVTGANGCTNTDSVNVGWQPTPVFSINPVAATICQGDSAILTASGADVYHWYSGNNITSPNSGVTAVKPVTSQQFAVALTHSFCGVSDTLMADISVNPLPVTTISKSNDIDCSNGSATLVATGGSLFSWSPSAGISGANTASAVVQPVVNTTYYVRVTNNDGCFKDDSIAVGVSLNPENVSYYVPSAFTPNKDGLNDCFGLKYWGRVQSLDFSVYNRWGERIFHSVNHQQCWDGDYKGMPQPAGTYVYQIKAVTACGNVFKKGTLVLIR